MKKLLILVVILFGLCSCITTVKQPIEQFPPTKVIVEVKTDKSVAVSKDKDTVSKVMDVQNEEMELSNNCRLFGKTAYITITSISSYGSEDMWNDLTLLHNKGIKNIVVYLNSPGGQAFQGMAFADELRIAKKDFNITMVGRGLIASAAVPVFLTGDYRIVSKNTIFLIHPAKLWKWGFFTEGLRELDSQRNMIHLLQNKYAEIVSKNSKLSKKRVLEMMKEDTWFTADKAKEYGFVDEIR